MGQCTAAQCVLPSTSILPSAAWSMCRGIWLWCCRVRSRSSWAMWGAHGQQGGAVDALPDSCSPTCEGTQTPCAAPCAMLPCCHKDTDPRCAQAGVRASSPADQGSECRGLLHSWLRCIHGSGAFMVQLHSWLRWGLTPQIEAAWFAVLAEVPSLRGKQENAAGLTMHS